MSDTHLQSGASAEFVGERPFFHGGKSAVAVIDPGMPGADGELLCGSASPNVALRYGPVVTCLTVTRWITMTQADFFANRVSFEDLRPRGVGAVILEGNSNVFDFPVETVFILDPAAVRVGKGGTVAALGLQLDDLPQREPAGPSEPGWDLYVECVFGGDLKSALEALEWEVGPHHWKVIVPANELVREFIGVVSDAGNGGYLAEDNFCTDVTSYKTLDDALLAVDVARQAHPEDRRMIADRLGARTILVDEVYEDEDAEVPSSNCNTPAAAFSPEEAAVRAIPKQAPAVLPTLPHDRGL